MPWVEEFRERRERRRARLRKVFLGESAPRMAPLERVLLVFAIVATAFVCWYFRLLKAKEFEAVAFAGIFLYFAGRRVWWSRVQARRDRIS